MARDFSSGFKKNLLSISPNSPILVLLEITHSQLTTPIRLVRDNKDCIYSGKTYIAINFDLTLVDDVDKQVPKATLLVSNVKKELVNWIEQSEGGFGALVRIILIQKESTDAELDVVTKVQNITVTQATISAELGYDDILNKNAVQIRYDEFEAPGLL